MSAFELTRAQFQDPALRQFLRDHAHDNPAELMLAAHRYPQWPMPAVAALVQARQKARHKLPRWAADPDIWLPTGLALEQCSSEATAAYKFADFAGEWACDLTGGSAVDTAALAARFGRVTYVEPQPYLVEKARHNFAHLGLDHVEVVCAPAADWLATQQSKADLYYLDPARRDTIQTTQRAFRFEEMAPDVTTLLPNWAALAHRMLLKAAPWLDIDQAMAILGDVAHVRVVAMDSEVKEVLYERVPRTDMPPLLTAVRLRADAPPDVFSFTRAQEAAAPVTFAPPRTYLYEPHAALRKAGAFRTVAARFGLDKLHPNSHLYTSDHLLADFPGRVWRVEGPLPTAKKALQRQLPDQKAHVVVRNYPLSVAQLRRKTGLQEGGTAYVLATTGPNQRPGLWLAHRVG